MRALQIPRLCLLLLCVGIHPTLCTKIESFRKTRPASGLGLETKTAPSPRQLRRGNLRVSESVDVVDRSDEKKKISLAIARPFSFGQTNALLSSFADWKTFSLSKDGCANYNVGLVLSFPRHGDSRLYKEVYDAYEQIKVWSAETNGWGGCITSIDLKFADIPAEEDKYSDFHSLPGGDNDWVNGPNRQFERLFRYIESTKKFDVWYLMEPDSYPRKQFWLDNLVEEITLAQPFALLGSKYNGRAWDEFADILHLDVLHHINGNCVYNVTNPLLLKMVTEFEHEADTIFNAIPFDLRLSQMMLEAASGKPCHFLFNSKRYHFDLPSKVQKFTGWWEEHASGYYPVVESRVISNMASMVYKPSEVEEYSLVHGKKVFYPWNFKDHGNITLVIKARSPTFNSDTLSLVLASSIDTHPFSEVIVIAEDLSASRRANIESTQIGIPIVTQERRHPIFMDICEAKVSSEWFVIVDEKYSAADDLEWLVSSDGFSYKPLVGTIPAKSEPCQDSAVCRDTVEHGKRIFPGIDSYVLSIDVIYHNDRRKEFCKFMEGHEQGTPDAKSTLKTIMLSGGQASDSVMATQYFAFLHRNGLAKSTYMIQDKAKAGINRKFSRRVEVVQSIERNIVNIDSTEKDAIPMYWHVPKSGGSTAKMILCECLGLVVASRSGAVIEERQANASGIVYKGPESLHIVHNGIKRYVNVDVNSIEGIKVAKKLDPFGSGLVDAIIIANIGLVTEHLLDSERGIKAKSFGIFRHPIERAASLFHYLQKAFWEPTFDPSLVNFTIEEWAMSGKAENNWLVRTLVGDMESRHMTEDHLELAKDLIQRKFHVGLTSEMELSWKHFRQHFGWTNSTNINPERTEKCFQDKITKGTNVNRHEGIERGSNDWEALAAINYWDIKLYNFVVELFWKTHGTLEAGSSNDVQIGSSSIDAELEGVSNHVYRRRLNQYPYPLGVDASAAIGWYPDWESSGENKCLNDDKVPTYMRNNPSQWVYDDLDGCCERFYGWDKKACTVASGGNDTTVYTNQWYVNLASEICEQDCVKDSSTPCGGAVDTWKDLFDSAADCCESRLSWTSNHVCNATSQLETPTGTSEWYVNYQLEKCVQDCDSSANATCGGILTSGHTDLYDSVDTCCSSKLGWVPSANCQAESANTDVALTGTNDWYANLKLNKCVQDCTDTSNASCGGLAKGWDETYTSAGTCCTSKFWWLERKDCIKS